MFRLKLTDLILLLQGTDSRCYQLFVKEHIITHVALAAGFFKEKKHK